MLFYCGNVKRKFVIMDYKTLLIEYFEDFNLKDLTKLKALLHPDVVLDDWECNVSGRDAVLLLANKSFEEFPRLALKVKKLLIDGQHASVEIELQLSSDLFLEVVDTFVFLDEKIVSIKAFKK